MLLTPFRHKAHARAECTVYRYGSEYDVIHTYSREEKDKEKPYNVHLIVYERPHKSNEWERAYSLNGNVDVAEGLCRLLESLRVGLSWRLDKPKSKSGTSGKNDDVENATKGSRKKDVDTYRPGKKTRHSRSRGCSRSRGHSRSHGRDRGRSRSHGRGRSRSPDRSRSR